jgi:DNA-binding LacI/PurR family transcriptional regulator
MSASKAIYKVIMEDIDSEISSGFLQPGDPIPSIRLIKEKYDVSQITALRVFKELSESGRIIKKDGQGYFVNDSRRKKESGFQENYILCCVYPMIPINDYDNYGNRLISGIMQECLECRTGLLFPQASAIFKQDMIKPGGISELSSCIEKLAAGASGIILDRRISDREITDSIMRSAGNTPFIVLGRKSELPLFTVSPPDSEGSTAAAQYALKAGYRKFIICEHFGLQRTKERALAFRRELLDSGVSEDSVVWIEDCFSSVEHNQIMLNHIDEKIKEAKEDNILIFATEDSIGRFIADEYVKKGGKWGDKIGLLSFGGLEYASQRRPHLATVSFSPEEMGKKAVEILLNSNLTPGDYSVDFQLKLDETFMNTGKGRVL